MNERERFEAAIKEWESGFPRPILLPSQVERLVDILAAVASSAPATPPDWDRIAREWLVNGGNGWEDGEDGIESASISGHELLSFLAEFAQDKFAGTANPADSDLLWWSNQTPDEQRRIIGNVRSGVWREASALATPTRKEQDIYQQGIHDGLQLASNYVSQHDNLGDIAAKEIMDLEKQIPPAFDVIRAEASAPATAAPPQLPIPPEQIGGPVHPVLANYILWLIKRETGAPDEKEFGDKLLAYLEWQPTASAAPSTTEKE